jgi:hypothetical protein
MWALILPPHRNVPPAPTITDHLRLQLVQIVLFWSKDKFLLVFPNKK